MTCPGCGHSNRDRAKFCDECGARLTAPPLLEPSRARSYTPRHLVDRVLSSRSALEGERKQVTVLFADVKGSMELAEEVDPEEWHRILDRFFAVLGDGVHRFEGTINQYTGDGVMALFGAPIAHEDHARRACYAALALRTELRGYAEELKRTRGLNFSVRMGLNSGDVIVGRIGDDLRMDYTAQGHTVGLAQRMEQLSAPGSAYLTENTARLVGGFVKLRDLGDFEIRGVADPVRVSELVDVGELRSRFDLSRARGLSAFVGRQDEMRLLEERLERSLAGEGQIVSLIGDPGVGKSRLSFEFLRRCRDRGIRVATGHAVSHGRSIPLLPWLSVFRSSFDVDERDPPARAREKVAGRAVLWDPSLSELLPVVFDFMGIADADAPPIEMDPDARRRKLLEFVCRASEARNRLQGGVLLWEDLHWLDPASDEMLAGWLTAVAGTRTLVVTNYRPEYSARWIAWSNHTTVRLRPLDSREARTLIVDLLGDDPTVRALPRMIEERTGGNPFFIEEVVQSLIESGDLRGKRGAYQLQTALRSLAIPGSVRAVLAARIDRLGEEQKSILQTASVLGKTFDEPVLEKTIGLPRSRLAEPLSKLQAGEMILEEALYPVRRLAFKHPLTQEVAYHSQLQDQRARTHRAAARAIGDLHPDQLDEKAALLAHHFEEGGKPLEAALWHARAAVWVGTRNIPEGLRHDRRAIELLQRVPQSEKTRALGARARARLLQLAWRAGMDADEEDRLFTEGTQLAEQLGDESLRVGVAIPYGLCLAIRGDEDGRERLGRSIYERAISMGERRLAVLALLPLTGSLMARTELVEALALLDRHRSDLDLVAPEQSFGTFGPHAFLLGTRAQVLALLGRFADARDDARRAQERALSDGQHDGIMNAHLAAAHVHLLAGDAAAVHHAERSLEMAERHGAPTYVCLAHLAMARACLQIDDARAATEHAEQAEGTLVAYGLEGFRSGLLDVLADAGRRLGTPDAASTAQQAVDLARRTHHAGDLVRGLLALAWARPADEAAATLEEADAILRRTQAHGLAPLVSEVRGAVAQRARDFDGARAAYEAAAAAWSAMGADARAARARVLAAAATAGPP